MFCTNCGKPVEAHYNVCPFCGASVNAAPTQNATFTEQPAFTAQPTFSASNSARAEELANSALTNLYGSIVYIDGAEMKIALEGFYTAIGYALPADSFYYGNE